ncbi:DUF423 domain-containing protein [Oceanicoccus sagamiensis]|uniref:DUF423 domain-containing protein n=1 Tax=Oceanicoccus sagamiensis TaxID=716816 RepID=A0A1X9NE66_9GAMM|nr:DUF423 domain-containing protein [Oceanicoccus sagamiensis]ARN74185.1 hypothetical protein BST96_08670 [Oceanicoccus sagamiensis]
MAKTLLMIAALSGLLAVAIGAFGAHGLKGRVTTDLMAVYQTGVQYHFYHTLALLLVGILMLQFPQESLLSWSGWLFVVGMIIFSGSLYVMALTGIKWLGAITPIGGVAFIAGWLSLAIAVYKNVGE